MSDEEAREFAAAVGLIRRNEIGRDARIATPFGSRLVCYADLTATGRHLRLVESWVRHVLPYYANTHTAVSSTGSLFTSLRESARAIVRRAVHAGPDHEVLFTGAGATAAVNKLVGLLGLRIAEPLERAYGLSSRIPRAERPVVFVGPYEHHSNLLPWTESIAEVVEIPLDASGRIDLAHLESALAAHAGRKLRIGTFSAASNVTGVLTDVRAITRILRRAGAKACFDYAAAGPYVPIDLRPGSPDEEVDAIFLSPHKFIGGPEGSGILVAKRELFRTMVPERPGGGTVRYVAGAAGADVDYLDSLTEREEGGTPAILGDLRAGAAFLVKEMLGPDRIVAHEISLAARAVERLERHPRIRVLGPRDLPRLAIVSFVVDGLHHDLVSALLDHLFGIQNRAGCSCAGPYGHALLGIDRARSERFRALVRRGIEGIKPGWVRLSIPYYASEEDVEFLLSAVEFLADHGDDFVPAYVLDWSNGVWRHAEALATAAPGVELTAEALRRAASETLDDPAGIRIDDDEIRAERAGYFERAREEGARLRERWAQFPPRFNPATGIPELDELVWFRWVHADRAGVL